MIGACATTNGISVPLATVPLSLIRGERDARSPALYRLQRCPDSAEA